MKKTLISLFYGVVLDRAIKTIRKVGVMPDLSKGEGYSQISADWESETRFSGSFVCRVCRRRYHVFCADSRALRLCADCLREGRN